MKQWEYCLIRGLDMEEESFEKRKSFFNPPWLIKFTTTGQQVSKLSSSPDEFAKTIAKLGEDGWEMVGSNTFGPGMQYHAIYFKRPKD